VEPNRFFRRRAPLATPRKRPEVRPRKLTRRSASPSGKVLRMMASVSRAGMTGRRADSAHRCCAARRAAARKSELCFIPHAKPTRNERAQSDENFFQNYREKRSGNSAGVGRGEFPNQPEMAWRLWRFRPQAARTTPMPSMARGRFRILLTRCSGFCKLSDTGCPLPVRSALPNLGQFQYAAHHVMHIPRVDITGLGENATDIILRLSQFPAPDGKLEISSVAIRFGGQIATAIVACRKWGLQARYIGSTGDDESADLHAREFARLGIEAHLPRRKGVSSRLSYVLVEEKSGSRTVLWQRDRRLNLRGSELKKEWITGSRLLLVDGENPLATRKAAQWAKCAGVPVICDFDSSTQDAARLLRSVDYPVLSSALVLRLANQKNYFAALRILRTRYKPRLICTTLGIGGALAWDGSQFWYSPSYRVRTIDTTGAGDLFHAGFAFGVLRGWDWQRILDFACAAAGLNCTREGARGRIGSIQEIDRLRRSKRRNPTLFSVTELKHAEKSAHALPG
jgi:sulfofructose kinase